LPPDLLFPIHEVIDGVVLAIWPVRPQIERHFILLVGLKWSRAVVIVGGAERIQKIGNTTLCLKLINLECHIRFGCRQRNVQTRGIILCIQAISTGTCGINSIVALVALQCRLHHSDFALGARTSSLAHRVFRSASDNTNQNHDNDKHHQDLDEGEAGTARMRDEG
jgi:hypothetical protein